MTGEDLVAKIASSLPLQCWSRAIQPGVYQASVNELMLEMFPDFPLKAQFLPWIRSTQSLKSLFRVGESL